MPLTRALLAAAALFAAVPPALAQPLAEAAAGPRLDLTLLGGLTRLEGHREAGLRFAEVALQAAPDVRTWLQYDDSLSLDNIGLVREGARAPAIYGGGLLAWGRGQVTRLEIGHRSLPGGADQWMGRGEQVVGLWEGAALKLGGWVGAREDRRVEAIAHGGMRLPLSERLHLEPTLFLARGPAGEREIRGLFAAEMGLRHGLRLGGGVAAGWKQRPGAADGAPLAAFARASMALSAGFSGQLFASHERYAEGPTATVVALGFTAALGGQP